MYKTVEHTLFIGKNIVHVPVCPSTNDLATRLLQQSASTEGTVVVTDHQTAGRGQRGNTWMAEPHQNLTFSVILKPSFLPVKDQFLLTVITALAVYDYLINKDCGDSVRVKWPNDLMVADKKIGGILIENQLQGSYLSSSVLGIGLNINQNAFSLPMATSLRQLTNTTFNLPVELSLLLSSLEAHYLLLRQGRQEELLQKYLQVLYRINEVHTYNIENRLMEATILGVDELGKLKLVTAEGLKTCDLKEIRYV